MKLLRSFLKLLRSIFILVYVRLLTGREMFSASSVRSDNGELKLSIRLSISSSSSTVQREKEEMRIVTRIGSLWKLGAYPSLLNYHTNVLGFLIWHQLVNIDPLVPDIKERKTVQPASNLNIVFTFLTILVLFNTI